MPKEYRARLSFLPHPVDPASGRPVPAKSLPKGPFIKDVRREGEGRGV